MILDIITELKTPAYHFFNLQANSNKYTNGKYGSHRIFAGTDRFVYTLQVFVWVALAASPSITAAILKMLPRTLFTASESIMRVAFYPIYL